MSGLASGIQFSAGRGQTCALVAGGGVFCWGGNRSGELGIGTTDTIPHPTPVQVPGLAGITAAASASPEGFSCAVRAGGGLRCWGDNLFAQLGDGTGVNRPSPVEVPSFTLNIVPTVQITSRNARKLTVNIVANCEDGEKLKLRIQVRQPSGAAGHGNETATCAGYLATFPVDVTAQGNTPFAPGAATVDAEAEIGNGGNRQQQTWTRAVQIVE